MGAALAGHAAVARDAHLGDFVAAPGGVRDFEAAVGLAHVVHEVPGFCAPRPEARQEGIARRAADGLVRVGAVEDDAALRQSSQVRCWDIVRVGFDGWAQVVDKDVEHVQFRARGGQDSREP